MAQTIGQFAIEVAKGLGMADETAQEAVAELFGELSGESLEDRETTIPNELLCIVWALSHDLADNLGVRDDDVERGVRESTKFDTELLEKQRVMLIATLDVRDEWFRVNGIPPVDRYLLGSYRDPKARHKRSVESRKRGQAAATKAASVRPSSRST